MPTWEPALYLQFQANRTRPASDLAAHIALPKAQRIIDLGCGPGNSTAVLRERWPSAHLVGMDSSLAMLADAAATCPDGVWQQGDIATWSEPHAWDIVFTNAALQWVPNHETLLPRLFRSVVPGGVFAAQIPTHTQSALHGHILELADDAEWRHLMVHASHAMNTQRPEFYYDILSPHAQTIDLWETVYIHVMPDATAILTWIKGTGLRPFLEALATDEQRTTFEQRLLERIHASYPVRPDGRVLFPFRRLFIVAS